MTLKQTDWSSYYNKKSIASKLTQKITQKYIFEYMNKYILDKSNLKTVEFGGANSCFFDFIADKFKPKEYVIIDNNQFGLDKFKENKNDYNCEIQLINDDILKVNKPSETFDYCYSIGLVEHFNIENTKKAIEAHFRYTKEQGIVLISFPTPTFQYRLIRKCMEALSLWKFFDERPLTIEEVMPILQEKGDVLEIKLIRRLPLTQMMCVVRKHEQ